MQTIQHRTNQHLIFYPTTFIIQHCPTSTIQSLVVWWEHRYANMLFKYRYTKFQTKNLPISVDIVELHLKHVHDTTSSSLTIGCIRGGEASCMHMCSTLTTEVPETTHSTRDSCFSKGSRHTCDRFNNQAVSIRNCSLCFHRIHKQRHVCTQVQMFW